MTKEKEERKREEDKQKHTQRAMKRLAIPLLPRTLFAGIPVHLHV